MAKRERCEAPQDAQTKRSNALFLVFYSSPALHDSTWTSGYMDIVADLGDQPFAYMVVTNGVFDCKQIHRNAQCELWKTLGWSGEAQLFRSLASRIREGCNAVVECECPSSLLLPSDK